MSPALPSRPSPEEELAEAQGHLTYFQRAVLGFDFAIKRMEEDKKACEKNAKLWQGRIEKMEARQKARNIPVAEGKASEAQSPEKEGDRRRTGKGAGKAKAAKIAEVLG